MLTITAAITVAESGDLPAIVQVNAGTYEVNSDSSSGPPTHVELVERVSLYGGYNEDFTVHDTAVNITTITDISTKVTGDSTSPNSALEAGANITKATIIDGFIINGTTQAGADYTAAVWTHDSGSPTVQNNTLNGGSGDMLSYGMVAFDSSPTVQNNTINGGSGSYSSGMYNDSSSPTVRNNTLNGGSGGHTFGMYNASNSSPTVQNNTLNGGSGGTWSYGMYNFFSSPIVRNNILNGGSGRTVSYGMYNGFFSSPIVQNNTLNGGSGGVNSTGMRNHTSSPTVQNNTINGGSSSDYSYGMSNNETSFPTMDNNIIFNLGAGVTYCIYESFADSAPASVPASVRNNDLFACTTVYRDYDAGCTGNGDDDGDATTCTLEEMEALTGGSGNVSVNPMFLDIDDDWHFSVSSPPLVTAGGLNGEDNGWGFTTDKDGVTRPGAGSNWSMGAYEP